jgi:2-oxoglutarate dehydrogenase E2 component (dihydrolipoamide succinyltransferase)
LEVPAPVAGILKEIIKPTGDIVQANQVIAVIEAEGAGAKKAPEAAPSAKAAEAPQKTSDTAASALSPSVRRAAAELDVDVSKVKGTGKDGRLTKENVTSAVSQGNSSVAVANVETQGARAEKRVPMTRMRARIAERLLEVKQSTAMLTTFNEINLSQVIELRNRYKDKFEKTHNARLGFMSFFVKAAVEALKRFPAVNASIDGGDVVYHGYFDIGVAVSTDRGLVVPVLRDADQMSMAEIENKIAEFATKARSGKLTMEEMQGGTFTITNGGVFGSLLSTPILNSPQSGILGMHKIDQRPVVENGQIVIRPMMYVALSYDHRIIDGKDSVTFLVAIKELLEDPARLLLEV